MYEHIVYIIICIEEVYIQLLVRFVLGFTLTSTRFDPFNSHPKISDFLFYFSLVKRDGEYLSRRRKKNKEDLKGKHRKLFSCR
jgi:hypothetical protein